MFIIRPLREPRVVTSLRSIKCGTGVELRGKLYLVSVKTELHAILINLEDGKPELFAPETQAEVLHPVERLMVSNCDLSLEA